MIADSRGVADRGKKNKMGQSQQTLRAKEVVKDLVFKPCQPTEYLEFNSQESIILSLTIDEQVSHLDAVHHLTEDAEQCGVAKWFEQAGKSACRVSVVGE